MFDEIKKSINSSLYERTKSPLYGTIILSWLVWNWRPIYYIFAVDEKTSVFVRLAEIQNKVTNNWTLFYGPMISTIIVLTIVQIAANYSYWLHVYFKTWRVNKKLMVEGKQLLSYEQSLRLRNEIRQKEEQYEQLIQEKELNIKQLQDINTDLQKKKTETSIIAPVEQQPVIIVDKKPEIILKKLEKEQLIGRFKDT